MALSRRRDGHQSAGPWPGYVDVLSTLLMVIVFVLAVFMLVQFFLANAISGRDKAIEGLRSELPGWSTSSTWKNATMPSCAST
jgi:chemotaxis protein MotB